jgi:class 3 adenylate cyclase
VIYHPTEALDLETEVETEFGPKVVEELLAAYLYELVRDDPTDPETGQVGQQPRAPSLTVSDIQRGSRTVGSEKMYSLGFSHQISGGTPTPKPLPST